ncbi:hypothetical protein Glove_209g61 [Diversispora epigaea]|uniref:Uncharacterized protein n=1 Tax=Diversispora epigaea TaxID=1348612 RepID=A0A397ILI4_9GLOM|nr:hypothetical protein Glove_209g61 [Diversispora epigaea]
MSFIARISCPASHILLLRPRVLPIYSLFFSIQKRALTKPPKPIPISSSASSFKIEDLKALKVSFRPASSKDIVIPPVEAKNYPKNYELPQIYPQTLLDPKFDVENLNISDKYIQTYIDNLYDVVKNSGLDKGTDESKTDTLVMNLLDRVVDMNGWPFKVRQHPLCQLVIRGEIVSARPEFVVGAKRIMMIAVEDKHLRNKMLSRRSGFGEAQIAAEILACGSENLRGVYQHNYVDQEIFAIRAVSTYFTFYRTVIASSYWEELESGLPKINSVVIDRWPAMNELKNDLDFAEPEKRKIVLEALTKIREYILQ